MKLKPVPASAFQRSVTEGGGGGGEGYLPKKASAFQRYWCGTEKVCLVPTLLCYYDNSLLLEPRVRTLLFFFFFSDEISMEFEVMEKTFPLRS